MMAVGRGRPEVVGRCGCLGGARRHPPDGFAKTFGYGELPQLTQPISRAGGVAWLAAASLIVVSAVMFGLGHRRFWMVSAVALVVSQVVIVSASSPTTARARRQTARRSRVCGSRRRCATIEPTGLPISPPTERHGGTCRRASSPTASSISSTCRSTCHRDRHLRKVQVSYRVATGTRASR